MIIGVLDGDVSRVIVDFCPPPLIIRKSQYYGTNGDQNKRSDVLLSFYDHFVNFNHESLIQFASRNLRNYKLTKTCFIQLFDEKEANLLLNDKFNDKLKKIYNFLTRLYCSAFETSHHIHLFAKHHRADIDAKGRDGDDGKHENKAKYGYLTKMKSMNIYDNDIMNGNRNKLIKNHHLLSFTGSTMKLLTNLLLQLISPRGEESKISPMTMYELNGSLSLISKIRLRQYVVNEIRSLYDPMYIESNQCMMDLIDHILRSNQKYQSSSTLRVSYKF